MSDKDALTTPPYVEEDKLSTSTTCQSEST